MEKLRHQKSHSDLLTYQLLFLFISIALVYSFSIDKHLSADGTHYFISILDNRNFTHLDWSRQFSNYLTEWILVLAVKLGLKDVPLLSEIYGVNIYFPYIASYLLCIYATRKQSSWLLMFPLVSIVGINFSGDYILIGEHHVMVLLSWPILFLSLRKAPLNWLDGLILCILLILFSRTYQAAIIPGIIFSTILGVRLYRSHQNQQQLIIFSTSLFLSTLILPIALYSIINPREPSNKAVFISAISRLPDYKEALVSASFAFLSTLGLIRRKSSFLFIALVPIFFYACIRFLSHGSTASESFNSRTLSLTLLPFLLICATISCHYNLQSNKVSTKILILFIVVMVVGNLHFSSNWSNFRKQVMDIVITNDGYIAIEDTAIRDSPYRWEWNNPGLGVIFSYPCVRSILLNGHNVIWEPFNPHEKLVLEKYIGYDSIFSSVDKSMTVCKREDQS